MLTVVLPVSDVETGQIQGLTWDYHFPALESLILYGHLCETDGLAKFLQRNSILKVVTLNLSTSEPFNALPNTLPNVESLCINFHARPELVSLITQGLTASPLRHLRIKDCPDDSYPELEALSSSLRCLELDFGGEWRYLIGTTTSLEDDNAHVDADSAASPKLPGIIKRLLRRLPKLQELALDIETWHTRVFKETTFKHPDAMDKADLVCLPHFHLFNFEYLSLKRFQKTALQLLGPDSQIRALRMSDWRGKSLPAQLLFKVPGVPPCLEYLKWSTQKGKVLYRLEQIGRRVKAVECGPPRVTEGNGFWIDDRVLDFEGSA